MNDKQIRRELINKKIDTLSHLTNDDFHGYRSEIFIVLAEVYEAGAESKQGEVDTWLNAYKEAEKTIYRVTKIAATLTAENKKLRSLSRNLLENLYEFESLESGAGELMEHLELALKEMDK